MKQFYQGFEPLSIAIMKKYSVPSKIMSIPGIGDTLGPMILGEIGDADQTNR
jgi:hypothetical protein